MFSPAWDDRGYTETTEGKRDTSQSPFSVAMRLLTLELS